MILVRWALVFTLLLVMTLSACVPVTESVISVTPPNPAVTQPVMSTSTPSPTVTLPAPTPSKTPSPQDAWLLTISSQEGYPAVYALRPDGTSLVKLMDELSGIYEAALSPDGTRIAFSANSPEDGAWDIYIMDVDGTDLQNLTGGRFDDRTGLAMSDTSPAWSPDGTQLALNSNGDIFVIAADGSGLVQLTDEPRWDYAPSWSPDGAWVAFTSERGESPDIYLTDARGSVLKRLTDNPGAQRPAVWSQDGSQIAFVTDQDGNEEIYVMDRDGAHQANLTQNPAMDTTPLWSPDGAHILFASDRDGETRYYLMHPDGSDPAPLPEQLALSRIMAWGYSSALSELARKQDTATPTLYPTQAFSIEQEKELALQSLLAFFELLHAGEYEQAAGLYGGSYETLMESNRRTNPKDHVTLLKKGCEINGRQCLRVHSTVLQEQVVPHEFQFMVEFEHDDGTVFVLGPCCGATETEMPPVHQFLYTVKRFGDQLKVMELPVYVP